MPKFDPEFNPILSENFTYTLFGSSIKANGLNVMCIGVGSLPEYQKDWGSLTATEWDYDNEDTNLEMAPKEMAQLRMRVLDDFKVQLKHPSSVKQWRTNKVDFYLRQWPEDEDDAYKKFLWRASEILIFEDTTPRFDFYSEVTRTQNRIMFSGWRFKLKEITEKGHVNVWIDSWPPGK